MKTLSPKHFGAAFWLLVLFSFCLVESSSASPPATPTPTPTPPFKMIIASDPQFDWYTDDEDHGQDICTSPTPGCSKHQVSMNDNTLQSNKIKSLAQADSTIKGLIVNGDLTAIGRGSELGNFQKFYEKDLGITLYPGLGNHDYAAGHGLPVRSIHETKNPSSTPQGCYNNECAKRMINYLSDYVKNTLNLTTFDALKTTKPKDLHRTFTGSLAYSWEIGNVHFVQLNNYPEFEIRFHHYSRKNAGIYHVYQIESARDWLENDLRTARHNKKHIILNYHQPNYQMPQPPFGGWLGTFIERYEVSAIF
ncbi:MAG: metallophosphoesterase family protein, partial [Chthoniobacterales bacterium]